MGSGLWLSPKYYYDKRIGWYEIMPAQAPIPNYMVTAPDVIHTSLGDLVVGSKDYEVAKGLGLLSGSDGILIANTGPGSTNQGSVQNASKSWFDLTNMVNVINTLQNAAASGNTVASSNTQVGSDTTGAASVLANVINLLASAWSWSNGGLSFFMQNFFGNHTGDVTLAPTQTQTGAGGQMGGMAAISNTGSDSTNDASASSDATLDVNAKSAGSIVNNVKAGALSGNADASGNTAAGNVSSGNAVAEVNIINMINSMIASGNSFFGILNIFGNFNGDILFPKGFLDTATGSSPVGGQGSVSLAGTGPGSVNQAGLSSSVAGTISSASVGGANNNITTAAASGGVNADSNTSVGSLRSGTASTTQSLFNLSNTAIFGDNAVLVLVNVLGHWVGKIMNIPGSATQSALLTGAATVGVNDTGVGSSNDAQVARNTTADINTQSTGTITNNVNVNAVSGDASAHRNTSVGDISSGDAKAASSVANIFNSVLNVKHWFGVLVINVFGDWLGDVNDNSPAGTVQSDAPSRVVSEVSLSPSSAGSVIPGKIIAVSGGGISRGGSNVSSSAQSGDHVLTAAASRPNDGPSMASKGNDTNVLFGLSAVVMLIAGGLAGLEKRLKGSN
jgi:hypothetical protein